MNESHQERHLQEIADTTTRQIAGPKLQTRLEPTIRPHEHSYHVATGGMVSILFCVTCGKSWILKGIQRNFRNIHVWEPIGDL